MWAWFSPCGLNAKKGYGMAASLLLVWLLVGLMWFQMVYPKAHHLKIK
jgi:hypothetical protein